jgi:hypothetical protein
MKLLTPQLHFALRLNAMAHRTAQERRKTEPDAVPVVKLFNPCGAATWLATELDEDGDTLFGLADLGFGCPELGSFSLTELESIRLPLGLGIERDLGFFSPFPLSVWAEWARHGGSIMIAEAALARAKLPLN